MIVKRFFSFIFLILSVLLISASFTGYIVRAKILSPTFYINSLEDANFYEESDIVVKNNIDSFLEEKLETNENNAFGPKLASKIARSIIAELDFAGLLQTTFENNITNVTDWLSGSSQLVFYFPRQELLKLYGGENGVDLFIDNFIEVSGINNLPECRSGYIFGLLDLANGKIECRSPELRNLIAEEIKSKLPENVTGNMVEGFLDSIAPNLTEETELTSLNVDMETIARLNEVPNSVRATLYFIIGTTFLGILFVLAATLFSPQPALTAIRSFLYSGIIMVIVALVSKFGIQVFANFYVWNKIDLPPDVFTEEQRQEIIGLFRSTSEALLNNLLTTILIVGGILIFTSISLIIVFRFARVIKTVEEEMVESDLEASGDDENTKQTDVSNQEFEKKLLDEKPELKSKTNNEDDE